MVRPNARTRAAAGAAGAPSSVAVPGTPDEGDDPEDAPFSLLLLLLLLPDDGPVAAGGGLLLPGRGRCWIRMVLVLVDVASKPADAAQRRARAAPPLEATSLPSPRRRRSGRARKTGGGDRAGMGDGATAALAIG